MPNMEQEGVDWSRWKITGKIKEKGLTMRGIARKAGIGQDTLKNALDRPWPKGERAIAEALGMTPEEIWPARYNSRVSKVA